MQQDRRFTVKKLTRRISELGKHLYLDTRPLLVEWQEGCLREAQLEGWQPCPPGSHWGRRDIWVAFRTGPRRQMSGPGSQWSLC